MKRIALLFAALVVFMALGAQAGTPAQGPTIRYHLDEGQVLVYRAVAEARIKGEGPRGDRRRDDDEVRTESESQVEMAFSHTAGTPHADGSTPITIEILDVKMRQAFDDGHNSRTIEMDAQGAKVYEGKKLVQEGTWGEIQLPGGLDLRVLLDARIEAVVDKTGRIGGFEHPDEMRQLLQSASFLHLLVHQPIFPDGPVVKGGSWKIDRELVFANPLRLRELVHLPGSETYTAVDAVHHLNRNCLKLNIRGDWPKNDLEGGEVKADGSGTAIVDFATGVLFTCTAKSKQRLEGSIHGARAHFEIENTSTVTYMGAKPLYDQYKAQRTPQG
ncbi:MAG: hypothetical protein JW889_15310 [Verrucomicrobia bacterium]|nr:hypothetical protein [Verrucomicrobiota bacterium]